jgi:hypothetical protein
MAGKTPIEKGSLHRLLSAVKSSKPISGGYSSALSMKKSSSRQLQDNLLTKKLGADFRVLSSHKLNAVTKTLDNSHRSPRFCLPYSRLSCFEALGLEDIRRVAKVQRAA